MASDFILLGYQAIKALLLADATVQANVRRFVWFDGTPWPESTNKKPGDFIELVLDWDTQADDMRTVTQTFGNTQADSTCPFIETETNEYVLTLTGDNVRLVDPSGKGISPAIAAIKRVLRATPTITLEAGCTARVGKVSVRNDKTSKGGDAAGTRRRVVKIRISVTVTFQGGAQS